VLFEVRRADQNDLSGIVEAYITSWRAGYSGMLQGRTLNEQAELRRTHAWMTAIRSPHAGVFVAVANGEVIGVIEVEDRVGDEGQSPEIEMLYVVPQWWGTGAAKALLAAGTAWIAARGHAVARLRVVEAQGRARHFYEREGWQLDNDAEPASNGFYRLVYYRRSLKDAI
jgi:GNAT superfamily N-acetyltransferase